MQAERWIALVALVSFSAYTVYCARTENFWRSLRAVLALRCGLQVTIDLYLGLFLFMFVVFKIEGSWLAVLLWLVPTLVLGNISTLFYFVLNFERILLALQ